VSWSCRGQRRPFLDGDEPPRADEFVEDRRELGATPNVSLDMGADARAAAHPEGYDLIREQPALRERIRPNVIDQMAAALCWVTADAPLGGQASGAAA
jgi:hypothetical protein